MAKKKKKNKDQPPEGKEQDTKKYSNRYDFLKQQYDQGWKSQQEDVSNYLLSNRGYFENDVPNQGDSTGSSIIDSEGTRANMIFAAGIHGGLTSPARPWLRLRLQDPDLSKFKPVKDWLDSVEKILYAAYSSSNFYQSIYTDYIELIGFGTSCLFQQSGVNTPLNFKVQTAGSYYIQANAMGYIDTVYTNTPMTAKNMVERFGNRNRRNVIEEAKKNPYQFFNVIHAVQPNNEREIGLIDGKNKVFESVYFEKGNSENILLKSGFEENPFAVGRYDVSGADVYGRGPGFDEMPNIKQLQEMQQTTYIALHKEIDPPLVAPSDLINEIDTLPGGITPYDGSGKVQKLHDIKFNIGETENKIIRLQEKIKEGFFNDLFLLINSGSGGVQPVTATQIVEQKEEKLIMLGPLVDRTIAEKLDPTVERTLGILFRGGFLPPAPEEIQGQQLDIEYVSLLAQAQKRIGSSALREFGAYVAEISTISPNAIDKMDTDAAINEFGDMVGAPPKVVRTDDEVKVIREARAQAQQQALADQQAQEAVQGAKTLSETNTEGTNALTDIAGAI